MARSLAFAATLLALSAASSASTGEVPANLSDEDYARHVASAGHKALFMCSGVFIAGRTPDQIRTNEFAYAADIFNAPGDAQPDYKAKTAVSTALDGKIEQLAVFREGLGCVLTGSTAANRRLSDIPIADIPRAAGDPARIAWPDGDMLPNLPLPPEVNEAKLKSAVEGMFDGQSYANPASSPQRLGAPKDMKTIGIVVVYKGKIIAERYSDGWGPHTQARTYSTAKSVANAYIGIRVQQGALRIDDPANFPEWRPGDPRRKITLRNFLNMSSGLECDSDSVILPIYFGGGADAATAAANRRLEAEPGSKWCYSNFDTISLARAVRLSLPSLKDYLTFPTRELFLKIGMRDTVAETDVHGNFIASSQIWTTPRDLARLGLLYLRDGVWNGQRIFPKGWVEFTKTPVPQPIPSSRGWSYGAQFWLINKNPRIPADAFTTGGHGGTYSTIIPSRDLVIVRMGLIDGKWNVFVGDIVEAVTARKADIKPTHSPH